MLGTKPEKEMQVLRSIGHASIQGYACMRWPPLEERHICLFQSWAASAPTRSTNIPTNQERHDQFSILEIATSWQPAAQLLADANVVWAAVRQNNESSPTSESKLMELLYKACKDTVKAASMLIKSLLAPKARPQAQPGQHVLAAAAVVSHELVEGLYDVLIKSQEQVDPNGAGPSAGTFQKQNWVLWHPR
jgi:hypothetical protein